MLVPLQAQHVNNWCTAVEAEIKELGKDLLRKTIQYSQ